MLGNVGTSEASKESCFLEIIFSSRMCRESNKVVRKTFTRNTTGSANSPLPVAFVCVCRHSPGQALSLPSCLHSDLCFSHTMQTGGLLQTHSRYTPDTHSLTLSAAQPKGCPVLLALSKKAGFSVTESKKEGSRQRRGLYKSSESARCHTQLLF